MEKKKNQQTKKKKKSSLFPTVPGNQPNKIPKLLQNLPVWNKVDLLFHPDFLFRNTITATVVKVEEVVLPEDIVHGEET